MHVGCALRHRKNNVDIVTHTAIFGWNWRNCEAEGFAGPSCGHKSGDMVLMFQLSGFRDHTIWGGGVPGHGARNHIYMHRSDAEGPKLNHNIYILVWTCTFHVYATCRVF